MADVKLPKAAPLKPARRAPAAIPAVLAATPLAQEAETKPFVAEDLAPPAAVPVAPPAVELTAPTPSAPLAEPIKGHDTMETINDTVNTAQNHVNDTVSDVTERATFMFNDMNGRAKDAMAKGTKAVEELVEFSKGNLEALVASGRVAAKGAEEIAKYSAEYGRSTIEKANATARQFASVKSPTEFFQLQGDIAKQTLDALVAEGSKFTENYLKLLGEVSQPISNRVAIAADKVKTTVVA